MQRVGADPRAIEVGPRAEGSMDLAQRLKFLESCHDWHTLLEELERAIQSEGDAATKAQQAEFADDLHRRVRVRQGVSTSSCAPSPTRPKRCRS